MRGDMRGYHKLPPVHLEGVKSLTFYEERKKEEGTDGQRRVNYPISSRGRASVLYHDSPLPITSTTSRTGQTGQSIKPQAFGRSGQSEVIQADS